MNTHFLNFHLSKRFKVSASTVSNWVKQAELGNNMLQLVYIAKKAYIADTPDNYFELERLTDLGKKFKGYLHLFTVEVEKDFYTIFDESSQIELIRDLSNPQPTLDIKYYYVQDGAGFWDTRYRQRVGTIGVDNQNGLNNLISSLKNKYNESITLIDIGCGNGEPIKVLLDNLSVSEYVAFDISKQLLNITTENLKNYNIPQTFHQLDFQKTSLENHAKSWLSNPNLFVLIGNTINNYKPVERLDILNQVYRSMNSGDKFIVSYSIRSLINQTDFQYMKDTDKSRAWLPRLLGINTSSDDCYYSYEYDNVANCKYKFLNLDLNYNLNFQIDNKTIQVNLVKDKKIVTWQHYMLSLEEIISEIQSVGLKIDTMNVSGESVMLLCGV